MAIHKTSGVVTYDPWRGDMHQRTSNWCVISVDREITRYYREWLRVEQHIHLQPPSWDAHISVIRGERVQPTSRHLWKKHHNRQVNIQYAHIGEYYKTTSGLKESSGGLFFMVNVWCPELMEIRQELGLPTHQSFHLTFGRIYEYEARGAKRR